MRMKAATLSIAIFVLAVAAVGACSGPFSSRQFSAVLQVTAEVHP